MAKIRVLLIMHELTMAGASRLALSTFQALRAELDVRTISNRGGPLEAQFAALGPLTVLRGGVLTGATARVIGTGHAQSFLEGVQGQTRSRLLVPTLRTPRPDVLYLNSAASLPIYARMPWVRRLDCPTILHVDELDVLLQTFDDLAPGLIRSVPDRYIGVSESVARALHKSMGVPRDRIAVIPPHLDKRWLRAASHGEDEQARHPGRFLIGGAGIPSWMKGIELWLLTAAELVRRHGTERFRFVWFGLGDDIAARQMRAMVGKLGLQELVELVPFAADPLPGYRSIDVLLVPSWEEPASLVTLEAMALGKVVACFRGSGGPAEEVAETGIIVDEFSPAAMADSLASASESPKKLAALGAAARERVATRYTAAVQAQRVLEEIRGLASRGKTS